VVIGEACPHRGGYADVAGDSAAPHSLSSGCGTADRVPCALPQPLAWAVEAIYPDAMTTRATICVAPPRAANHTRAGATRAERLTLRVVLRQDHEP